MTGLIHLTSDDASEPLSKRPRTEIWDGFTEIIEAVFYQLKVMRLKGTCQNQKLTSIEVIATHGGMRIANGTHAFHN